MDTLVEIQNLSKRFGPIVAVDDISFNVNRGEVLGFLGPNGAGKSTTMKMVTCFLAPTSGTAKVCGHDIWNDVLKVREKIGYLPEGAPAYGDMTTLSFLLFIAEIRGFKGAERKKRVDRAVELVGLEGVLLQPIDTLSKGFKRRVGLAQSILHDPEVLILDEPTDGLDPNQKHEVRTLIKRMSENKVIILSTHILEEVDAVCSRAIIIAKGKLIFDGTPEQLESKSRFYHAVSLTIDKDKADAAQEAIKGVENVASVELLDDSPEGKQKLMVFPKESKVIIGSISDLAHSQSWNVEEMHSEPGRLDEVFRTLTTSGAKGGS